MSQKNARLEVVCLLLSARAPPVPLLLSSCLTVDWRLANLRTLMAKKIEFCEAVAPFTWTQSDDSVEVYIPVGAESQLIAEEVKVNATSSALKVEHKGAVLLDVSCQVKHLLLSEC